jgi:protein-S-isoprenylcysteine O-methyltransferase Ste14
MPINKRTVQRIRVPLGFLFAVLFLVFARPTFITIVIGSGIAIVGLLVRAWASGHIRKAKRLAVSGPYAFSRNPLYVGSFIMGVGFSVAAGVWWLSLTFALLFLGIYLPVMRVESDDLRAIFGSEYDEYQRSVPVFFPRLTPWRRPAERFDFQLYLQYREYRAAVGVALAIGFLIAKSVFFRDL